jgi:cysteine desulfurase family protein
MIYFDNAATSYPKPPEMFSAMQRFMAEAGGNPGRSGHRMATGAEATILEARQAVARFFGLSDPRRCIFTLNGSDALNMALKGLLRPGDHAVTSSLEHNSINRPLQRLADEGLGSFERVAGTEDGAWTVDAVLRAIRPTTRLVALTHCPNAVGVLCPVEDLGRELRTQHPQVLFLVDAAQSAGVVPLDMETAGIDLLAFAGHKALFGPPGTGALLVGPRVRADDLQPWREGGTGGDSASPRQPREWPYYLEGGTPNTMGIAGLLAGIRFLQRHPPGAILEHERALVGRMIEGLAGDGRFTLHGTLNLKRKAGALSITVNGRDPSELALILDQAFGICARPGLHCAPHAHRTLGTFPGGTLRFSPGCFNTLDEVDHVVQALKEIA